MQESSVGNEFKQSALEKIRSEQPTEEEVTSVSSISELSDINKNNVYEYIEESKEDYVKEYIGKFLFWIFWDRKFNWPFITQVLFSPTTREEKYKAKQAIDTFFLRAGDLLSSGIVLLRTLLLAFQIKHFAIFNMVLVVIWLIPAVAIGSKNKKLTAGQSN